MNIKTIRTHAKEHSMIHRYAWILSNGADTFYTDSDELTQKYVEAGYICIGEYYDGYKLL